MESVATAKDSVAGSDKKQDEEEVNLEVSLIDRSKRVRPLRSVKEAGEALGLTPSVPPQRHPPVPREQGDASQPRPGVVRHPAIHSARAPPPQREATLMIPPTLLC
jgi:hypothetical protein